MQKLLSDPDLVYIYKYIYMYIHTYIYHFTLGHHTVIFILMS